MAVGLVLAVAPGCRKKPDRVTPIPGLAPGQIGDKTTEPIGPPPAPPAPTPAPPFVTTPPSMTESGIETSKIPLNTWQPAAEQPFKADTVYFDFDKSNIKSSEAPKIERVANGMKNYPGKALRVEGHCDERGTEEYNRALGERRALAIREYLVRLGLNAELVDTISYGEDRPVDPGHNEAAWSKNRRGEFILLEPPR